MLLLLSVLILIISTTTISSAEESLIISQWIVNAELLENGDLDIVEDITFNFREKYNGVFREIVLKNTAGIDGIRVVENSKDKVLEYKMVEKAKKGDENVFLLKEEKHSITLQIFTPSKNTEEKNFRIIYTVKDVAKKYNDIGELYYKFLGSENDTSIDFFSVNIILPEKDVNNKVKIFAHGPLNGEIHKVSDNTINLQVDDVPKDTFIEARILFPKEFIPTSQNTIDKDAYSDIMEEEARLKEKIQEKIVKREARGILFGNIAIIFAAIEMLIFILLIIKYRRLKDIHTETTYSEVPEDNTPAVVSYISSHAISINTIIATVLDLYRKGYIKIHNGEEFKKKNEALKDFTITKVKEENNNLLSHEKYFINWLIDIMGDGNSVTTNDIESYSKNNSSMFTKHYSKWIELIKEDAHYKGYFDGNTKKYGLPLVIIFPIGLILSIIALVHENILGLPLIFTSILMLIQGIMLLSRRSNYGYVEYKRWMAFKKHMKKLEKDDSIDSLDEYPKDISLIYGLALGIHNNILDKFDIKVTDGENTYSYGWMYWYFILNNDKNNAFNKSINNSFSSISPQTGQGGSFSSGGGGGAGGGGAGGF